MVNSSLTKRQQFLLLKLVDLVLIASLLGSIKLLNHFYPPFLRQFSVNDVTIAYPHAKKEIIPNIWLWTLSLILPIVVILLVWIKKRDHRETYTALVGLLLSSMLAYFICHFVKNFVGRLRPDYLARCRPDLTKINKTSDMAILVDQSICTAKSQQEKKDLTAGSKSFFSGHTSTAFSGLGFLSLYLAYAFCLWRRPGQVYKVIIVMLPLLVALFIGLSRISDYRHHWEDVFVGMIVGLLCALVAYHQYFPIDKKPTNTTSESIQIQLEDIQNAP